MIGPGILGTATGWRGCTPHPWNGQRPGLGGQCSGRGTEGLLLVDPTEQLAVVYMAQTPGRSAAQARRLIKQVVTQAIAD